MQNHYPPHGQRPPYGYYPDGSHPASQGQGQGQYHPPAPFPPYYYPPPQGQPSPFQGQAPNNSSPYQPHGQQYPPPSDAWGPTELAGSIPPRPPVGPPLSYGPHGASHPYATPPMPPPPHHSGVALGAPSHAQYGPPQPPPGGGHSWTRPSLGYEGREIDIPWDAGPDAQALERAMKGFRTDKKTLIQVLAHRDPLQIEKIKKTYYLMYRKELESRIKSAARGNFEDCLVAILRGPLRQDVYLLHEAMAGAGTKEKVLNEVLLGRSNADMRAIKNEYQKVYGRSLEKDVKGDLSFKTERHFLIALAAERAEDGAPLFQQAIDQDVMNIFRATEGKIGTDEMIVCSILSTRSDKQIEAISRAYRTQFQISLEDVIKKEFSGHMKTALLYQLRHGENRYLQAAELLEEAMAGAGTNDTDLISRVVRYHWDQEAMRGIKNAYAEKYRNTRYRSLADRIRGDTSGDYESLLLACIGE